MKTPYYAVIFTSKKNPVSPGYDKMSDRINELAKKQDGYLGIDSVRNELGEGITVSYWQSLESIQVWKANAEHLEAQKFGKEKWYESYSVRICKVEREYHNPIVSTDRF